MRWRGTQKEGNGLLQFWPKLQWAGEWVGEALSANLLMNNVWSDLWKEMRIKVVCEWNKETYPEPQEKFSTNIYVRQEDHITLHKTGYTTERERERERAPIEWVRIAEHDCRNITLYEAVMEAWFEWNLLARISWRFDRSSIRQWKMAGWCQSREDHFLAKIGISFCPHKRQSMIRCKEQMWMMLRPAVRAAEKLFLLYFACLVSYILSARKTSIMFCVSFDPTLHQLQSCRPTQTLLNVRAETAKAWHQLLFLGIFVFYADSILPLDSSIFSTFSSFPVKHPPILRFMTQIKRFNSCWSSFWIPCSWLECPNQPTNRNDEEWI